MKLKVFIGSSSEAKAVLEQVALWIEECDHDARPWTDPITFPLGETTLNALRGAAREADAAVFLMTEDDHTWYRGGKTTSPRDNVQLEYGLFSGVLGEGRVVVAVHGKPKLATDLAGVTYLVVDRPNTAKAQLRNWLKKVVEDAAKTSPFPLSPFKNEGKQHLFEAGTRMIASAKRRVALVARTPIPILGCRPYGKPGHAIGYETEQLRQYERLAELASTGTSLEFRCVASVPATKSELGSIPATDFRRSVWKNVVKLSSLANRPSSRFQLSWTDDRRAMTYLVADDDFLLWFKDRSGENVWIAEKHEPTALALWDESERIGSGKSMASLRKAFGL